MSKTLKKRYPSTDIIVSQIPPRKFDKIKEVAIFNKALLEHAPKEVTIVQQSSITDTHMHDNKHIKKNNIGLFVKSIKDTIRKNSYVPIPAQNYEEDYHICMLLIFVDRMLK